MIITSAQNAALKSIKHLLSQKKARTEANQFVIETEKQVAEYLTHFPQHICSLYVQDDYLLSSPLNTENHTVYTIQKELFKQCHRAKTSAGISAVVSAPTGTQLQPASQKKIWFLDNLSKPQNIGAVLRNALAFNIDLVIMSPNCADATHPEAIRALTTCLHHIPLHVAPHTILKDLSKTHQLVALDSNETTPINKLPSTHCIIYGSETGLTEAIDTSLDIHKINIPINPKTDSLNVAACSAIIGYIS